VAALEGILTEMEEYANSLETLVDQRTADYLEEKKRCEDVLYQLLPRFGIRKLPINRSDSAGPWPVNSSKANL